MPPSAPPPDIVSRRRQVRDRAIERARWQSRTWKARHVADAIAGWGGVARVLLVGAGQAWTPLDLVVENAAARGCDFVVATDLHEVTQVPWPYVRADGLRLPFADDSFDLVLSNAVIEHVGDADAQRLFVSEHLRVAPKFIITTPNRWFPMETHTKAVLRHWSATWRAQQTHEFTRLLSRRELQDLLPPGSVVRGRVWNSTYVAVGERVGAGEGNRTPTVSLGS